MNPDFESRPTPRPLFFAKERGCPKGGDGVAGRLAGGRGKNIVYLSREASQAAAVAAGLHLGILSAEGIPRLRDLIAAPYFGALSPADSGFLHFCGVDETGRAVYVAGCGRAYPLVARALKAAARLAGLVPEDFHLVDCTSALGPVARLGGFLWGSLRAPRRARLFLAWTLRRSYSRLALLVARTRDSVFR